jgi:hypothetical protein
VLGGLGVLIGVAYTLRVVGKAFYSGANETDARNELARPHPHERETDSPALEPITIPERMGAALLIG